MKHRLNVRPKMGYTNIKGRHIRTNPTLIYVPNATLAQRVVARMTF